MVKLDEFNFDRLPNAPYLSNLAPGSNLRVYNSYYKLVIKATGNCWKKCYGLKTAYLDELRYLQNASHRVKCFANPFYFQMKIFRCIDEVNFPYLYVPSTLQKPTRTINESDCIVRIYISCYFRVSLSIKYLWGYILLKCQSRITKSLTNRLILRRPVPSHENARSTVIIEELSTFIQSISRTISNILSCDFF